MECRQVAVIYLQLQRAERRVHDNPVCVSRNLLVHVPMADVLRLALVIHVAAFVLRHDVLMLDERRGKEVVPPGPAFTAVVELGLGDVVPVVTLVVHAAAFPVEGGGVQEDLALAHFHCVGHPQKLQAEDAGAGQAAHAGTRVAKATLIPAIAIVALKPQDGTLQTRIQAVILEPRHLGGLDRLDAPTHDRAVAFVVRRHGVSPAAGRVLARDQDIDPLRRGLLNHGHARQAIGLAQGIRGNRMLISPRPAAGGILAFDQVADSSFHRLAKLGRGRRFAVGQEREQRQPRHGRLVIGPGALGVLVLLQPAQRAQDAVFSRTTAAVAAHGSSARARCATAVNAFHHDGALDDRHGIHGRRLRAEVRHGGRVRHLHVHVQVREIDVDRLRLELQLFDFVLLDILELLFFRFRCDFHDVAL